MVTGRSSFLHLLSRIRCAYRPLCRPVGLDATGIIVAAGPTAQQQNGSGTGDDDQNEHHQRRAPPAPRRSSRPGSERRHAEQVGDVQQNDISRPRRRRASRKPHDFNELAETRSIGGLQCHSAGQTPGRSPCEERGTAAEQLLSAHSAGPDDDDAGGSGSVPAHGPGPRGRRGRRVGGERDEPHDGETSEGGDLLALGARAPAAHRCRARYDGGTPVEEVVDG